MVLSDSTVRYARKLMRIIADIGGTNVRLDTFDPNSPAIVSTNRRVYRPADFSSLSAVISQYMQDINLIPYSVEALICGIPGHVVNNRVSMERYVDPTNINRSREYHSLGDNRWIRCCTRHRNFGVFPVQ